MPHWSVLYLVSEWVIRLVMLVYVPPRRSAAATRTWLLLIFLLPWPGLLLYALMGRIYVSRHRINQQARASKLIREFQERLPDMGTQPELPATLAHIPEVARRLGDFRVFGGNQAELLDDYRGAIDQLLADIEGAQHHVHLLTYIFAADATGRRVSDALMAAAKRGVNCRLLADAVGSKAGLAELGPALVLAGVEVVPLLRVGFFRRNAARFDLRNHRKLAVIDGRIGYTGSQNLVDPDFVPGFPNEELVVRLTGPVVPQLQAVFVADRFFETEQILGDPELYVFPPKGSTHAQVVASGPGYQQENFEEILVSLLFAARSRVVLTTPYFVPSEPFLEALCAAARRGVEVRLVVSRHANQFVTQLAQGSYYDELLGAGVIVHLYQPRFLHAKHVTIDGDVALVGSTNIDIRSFALNAEVGVLLYDRSVVDRLRVIQERYFAASEILNPEAWSRRPITHKVAQNLARLADSLL